MIPAFLIKRFGPVLAKGIVWGVAAALALAILGVAKCSYHQRARTEIKLSKGQAGAAVASGSDAVGTLGNRMRADAEGDQVVTETKDAIDGSNDSAAATAAGRNGLCRLSGYRGKPECVH